MSVESPPPVYPAGLLGIPSELLLLISDSLPVRDTYHLALANKRLGSLLLSRLQRLALAARCPKTGESVLHWAVLRVRVPLIRSLLACGADPNCVDKYGRTPLHIAARYDLLGIVRQLLAAGAHVDAAEEISCATPLHDAARRGSFRLARLLLDKGASVAVGDFYGRTPLWWAASGGHAEIVGVLLLRGADPSVADAEGITPLDLAEFEGRRQVVRLLGGK